jgi:orotate phosphoribosyltransferase
MVQTETIRRLTETGAMLEGHFLLSSGLHSNRYVQCARILMFPEHAEWCADRLAEKLPPKGIDLVVSPAIGGIVIGQEVAHTLDVPHIFVEKDNGVPVLRRGFTIEKGTRCIVVEDVVTTGKSTLEVIKVIEEAGGKVVAACAIVDRSAGVKLEVPFHALAKLEIEVFEPEDCTLCKKDIPLVKPGSRAAK